MSEDKLSPTIPPRCSGVILIRDGLIGKICTCLLRFALRFTWRIPNSQTAYLILITSSQYEDLLKWYSMLDWSKIEIHFLLIFYPLFQIWSIPATS